jgi:hypothetical protein
MSRETKPTTTEGSEQSGLLVFLRVIGLLLVGPGLLLYVLSLIVS